MLPFYSARSGLFAGRGMIFPVLLLLVTVATSGVIAESSPPKPGYLRYPDLHGSKIVFTTSGDLFVSDISGQTVTRLTSHSGDERFAKFSPDGEWIAFTGQYYGNDDIYVMPTAGGEPRQLTFHTSGDRLLGWDKQGRILFSSDRLPPYRAPELYAVSIEGGFPEKLPYFRGAWLAEEPAGPRVALIHNNMAFHIWNRYKGGQAEKIWIGDPSLPHFERISHYTGNESFPMWADNGRVYFVMDSTGRENLWSMLPDGSDLLQETNLTTDDVRWPSLHGDRIIFQRGMGLAIFELDSRKVSDLAIEVPGDFHMRLTRFVDPNHHVTHWSLNQDGSRIIVAARGEVFTLPVKGAGLIRQWTFSSASREKAPQFLPGDQGGVVLISDENGEERLMRLDRQRGELASIESDPLDDWKNGLAASPDGSKLAYASGTMKLHLVDLKSGRRSEIDQGGWEFTDFRWSPDSRYLAYSSTYDDRSYLYVYDTQTMQKHLVSDPQYATHSPAWDPEGRFLYCVSERNFNAFHNQGRGLFYFGHTSTMMLIRLRAEVPDPFLAHGDQHSSGLPEAPWMTPTSVPPQKEKKKEAEDEGVKPIVIEWEGIVDRSRPIPEPAGNYGNLEAVGDKFYYVDYPVQGMAGRDGHQTAETTIRLYDLAKRESKEVAVGTGSYELSGDQSVIVIRKGQNWYYGDSGSNTVNLDNDHRIPTDGWSMEVQPGQEWQQILRETWRQQREFFYEYQLHGVDWEQVYDRWSARIARMTTRDDLLDVLREMQAELNAGHAYVWGGDMPDPDSYPIGYLGIDVEPDPAAGYYRITRVLAPEPGTENGTSPLHYADPKAGPGTWIIAIDGIPVEAGENLYRYLQNRAGQTIALTLNDTPAPKGSREVILTTLESEQELRYNDWSRSMQQYVSDKSDNRVGYFHLRNMGGNGMSDFGRNYYPQRLKPGMIVDDRYNGGGNISELLMKEMTSPIFALQSTRYSAAGTKPPSSYFGHMAILINEATASDGESMAYAARTLRFAELIGERTWGGWIWIWPRRPNVDGGGVSVPEFGGWGLDGDWIIEGPGVYPEVEVINDPASEMQGIDPQLDYAIKSLLKKIAEEPRVLPGKPAKGPMK